MGADYLSDDFTVAHGIARLGILDGMLDLSFQAPARPLVGPYYVVTYQLIGERMLLHAIVMALLNGVVAVAVWHALRTVVGKRTALLAALVFAVVPNRGATRLWFVLGPNLLAVALLGAGAVLLLRRQQVLTSTVLFVAAILAYEGVAGVAALVVAWWWVQERATRTRHAVLALGAVVATTAGAWAISPKRGGDGPRMLANLDTLSPAQLGAGFWGSDALAGGRVVFLVAAAWCLAVQLPSFRRPASPLPRELLLGACVLVAGAAPFVVGGAPFAVRGIFDRNNLVAGVGSSLALGAILAAAVRRSNAAGGVAAGVVIAVLAVGNIGDVADYRQAVEDGRELVEAVTTDVDPDLGVVVVTPPLTGPGVSQFILHGDLTAALLLREGPEWASVRMPRTAARCSAILGDAKATGRAPFVYDRISRVLVPAPDPHLCRDG